MNNLLKKTTVESNSLWLKNIWDSKECSKRKIIEEAVSIGSCHHNLDDSSVIKILRLVLGSLTLIA